MAFLGLSSSVQDQNCIHRCSRIEISMTLQYDRKRNQTYVVCESNLWCGEVTHRSVVHVRYHSNIASFSAQIGAEEKEGVRVEEWSTAAMLQQRRVSVKGQKKKKKCMCVCVFMWGCATATPATIQFGLMFLSIIVWGTQFCSDGPPTICSNLLFFFSFFLFSFFSKLPMVYMWIFVLNQVLVIVF